MKQQANYYLFEKVLQCRDAVEYESLRQQWDTVNKPQYRDMKCNPEQEKVINLVKDGVSYDEQELRRTSPRWL